MCFSSRYIPWRGTASTRGRSAYWTRTTLDPPFDEYHFVDANTVRAEQLRAYASGRTDVHVYAGDCNDVLLQQVYPLARYSKYKRALCILDPYNIDISWEVVRTAGQMRSVEIFLNFMVMDMNMNIPEKTLRT